MRFTVCLRKCRTRPSPGSKQTIFFLSRVGCTHFVVVFVVVAPIPKIWARFLPAHVFVRRSGAREYSMQLNNPVSCTRKMSPGVFIFALKKPVKVFQ